MELSREEWADEVSTFFCGHAPDNACENCYNKALRAYDKVAHLESKETDPIEAEVKKFAGEIESEDLRAYVKHLEEEIEKKNLPKAGRFFVNLMSTITFVSIALLGILAIGLLVKAVQWVFGG